MKKTRVLITTLSDNSFLVNVPLSGQAMDDFEMELSSKLKGSLLQKAKEEDIPFLIAFTGLTSEKVESLSNRILADIHRKGGK